MKILDYIKSIRVNYARKEKFKSIGHICTINQAVDYVERDVILYRIDYVYIFERVYGCRKCIYNFTYPELAKPEDTLFYVKVVWPWLNGDQYVLYRALKNQNLKIPYAVYNDAEMDIPTDDERGLETSFDLESQRS